MTRRTFFVVLACPCAALLGQITALPVAAAEIRVAASLAMRLTLEDLLPRYQASSGDVVVVEYGTAPAVRQRIESDAPLDVAVTTAPSSKALIASGRLLPEPRDVVGVTAAMLAYPTGAPKPEIGTEDHFKTTVLSARAISLSDPTYGGASSLFFLEAVRRLGIEGDLKGKLIFTPAGSGAAPVANGQAQYGVALSSEVAGTSGLSTVPLFPGDPAAATTLVATVSARSVQPAAARAFVTFLSSPEAMAVRRARGLTPE